MDPSTSLGLNEESVYTFSIGDLVFGKGMVIPDLLPCGYLVGDNTNITITLNGKPYLHCYAFLTLLGCMK